MNGSELRQMREAAKLSRRKLAQAMGVAENTIYRYEMGRTAISEPMEKLIRYEIGSRG